MNDPNPVDHAPSWRLFNSMTRSIVERRKENKQIQKPMTQEDIDRMAIMAVLVTTASVYHFAGISKSEAYEALTSFAIRKNINCTIRDLDEAMATTYH